MLSLVGALCLMPNAASARDAEERDPPGARGRPDIVLDALTLPASLKAMKLEKELRRMLTREARRVRWGAGTGAKVRYRFELRELTVEHRGDVAQVRCVGVGRLPHGRSAKSSLRFGGDRATERKLVLHVLEIVVRGVLERLSDLERSRRLARQSY